MEKANPPECPSNGTIFSAKHVVYPDQESKDSQLYIYLDGEYYRLSHVKTQPAAVPSNLLHKTLVCPADITDGEC